MNGLYLVTGGGSGIGAGVARALKQAGANVVVADLNEAAATAVAEELDGQARQVDISDPASVDRLFAGLGPLHGAVLCAGNTAMTPVLTATLEEWRAVTSVQLDGTFLCLQGAARNMVANGVSGSIVTTSSVNASFGHRGLGAYSAAKAGITMLTKVAALELAGAGIRVNAVAPGIVATGMTAGAAEQQPGMFELWGAGNTAGRVAQPADIADLIIFLASPASRWVNGQTIAADAGASLRAEPKIYPDEAWSAEALANSIS